MIISAIAAVADNGTIVVGGGICDGWGVAGATGGVDAHPASARRTSNQTTRWDMGQTSWKKDRMEHATAMAI